MQGKADPRSPIIGTLGMLLPSPVKDVGGCNKFPKHCDVQRRTTTTTTSSSTTKQKTVNKLFSKESASSVLAASGLLESENIEV